MPTRPKLFGTATIPYRTSPESFVRPQYPTEHSGKVRYDLNIYRYTTNFVKGIILYRVTGGFVYPTEVVRYGHNTLPNSPVWLGTNSIRVLDTSVRSVRPPKTPRVPVSPTVAAGGVLEDVLHPLPSVPATAAFSLHCGSCTTESWSFTTFTRWLSQPLARAPAELLASSRQLERNGYPRNLAASTRIQRSLGNG